VLVSYKPSHDMALVPFRVIRSSFYIYAIF